MAKPKLKWRKEGDFYLAGKFKVGKIGTGWEVYKRVMGSSLWWPEFKHPFKSAKLAKAACEE